MTARLVEEDSDGEEDPHLQLDEGLADHRLVLALASLDGQHRRERHTPGCPLLRWLDETLEASHHAGASLADDCAHSETRTQSMWNVSMREAPHEQMLWQGSMVRVKIAATHGRRR